MRWFDHQRKIAVTGLAGAGKTVFLLSLLQHLEFFDPGRFRPAGGLVSGFRELPVYGDFDPLPRTRLRARMLDPRQPAWPAKTKDTCSFRCSFEYSGLGLTSRLWNTVSTGKWLSRRVEWNFLDFPGERLSDALIAKHESFAGWSDELLSLWDADSRLRGGMEAYLRCLEESPAPGGQQLTAVYKQCLARMVNTKHQLITPSSFLLSRGVNSVFSRTDAEDGGIARLCGLEGAEFTPLPSRFRDAHQSRAGTFAAHYSAYREREVRPLFDAVSACDTLLLLLDIPGILSGGAGRYHDTVHLIGSLADVLIPSGWFSPRIGKAAFIAAKADMVHARDQDSLRELAACLMQTAQKRGPGIDRCEAFAASAWVSSESAELTGGGRALRGVPVRDTERRLFRVPPLPQEWPADWEPEDPRYSYPRLSPPRPAGRFDAPPQRNLDRIFDFLLS